MTKKKKAAVVASPLGAGSILAGLGVVGTPGRLRPGPRKVVMRRRGGGAIAAVEEPPSDSDASHWSLSSSSSSSSCFSSAGGERRRRARHRRRMREAALTQPVRTKRGKLHNSGTPRPLHRQVSERTARRRLKRMGLPTLEAGKEPRFGERAGEAVSYRDQGNPDWHAQGALKIRQALRYHPSVVGEMQRFWRTFAVKDMRHGLLRNEYVKWHLKVTKVLYSDWTPGEARSIAMRDWQRDVGSATGMAEDSFYSSLFELIDLWTETAEWREYVAFLRQLYARIARVVSCGSSRAGPPSAGPSPATSPRGSARGLRSARSGLPAPPSGAGGSLALPLAPPADETRQRWRHMDDVQTRKEKSFDVEWSDGSNQRRRSSVMRSMGGGAGGEGGAGEADEKRPRLVVTAAEPRRRQGLADTGGDGDDEEEESPYPDWLAHGLPNPYKDTFSDEISEWVSLRRKSRAAKAQPPPRKRAGRPRASHRPRVRASAVFREAEAFVSARPEADPFPSGEDDCGGGNGTVRVAGCTVRYPSRAASGRVRNAESGTLRLGTAVVRLPRLSSRPRHGRRRAGARRK